MVEEISAINNLGPLLRNFVLLVLLVQLLVDHFIMGVDVFDVLFSDVASMPAWGDDYGSSEILFGFVASWFNKAFHCECEIDQTNIHDLEHRLEEIDRALASVRSSQVVEVVCAVNKLSPSFHNVVAFRLPSKTSVDLLAVFLYKVNVPYSYSFWCVFTSPDFHWCSVVLFRLVASRFNPALHCQCYF